MWIGEHVVFLATLSLSLLIVLKLLVISRHNFDIALAMIGTAPATVITGTLVLAFPLVALLVGGSLLQWVIGSFIEGLVIPARVPALFVGILLVLFIPYPLTLFFAAFAVLALVPWALKRLRQTRAEKPEREPDLGREDNHSEDERPDQAERNAWKSTRAYFSVLFVYVLLALLLNDDVWLPAERIDLMDSGRVVGYVISDQSEWVTILRESDRSLLRVSSSLVSDRQVCELPRGGRLTLPGANNPSPVEALLRATPPSLPDCPLEEPV